MQVAYCTGVGVAYKYSVGVVLHPLSWVLCGDRGADVQQCLYSAAEITLTTAFTVPFRHSQTMRQFSALSIKTHSAVPEKRGRSSA